MAKENLKEELDFWVKKLLNLANRNVDLTEKLERRLKIAEEKIDCLETYLKKTVHPNLIHLREKTKEIDLWKRLN